MMRISLLRKAALLLALSIAGGATTIIPMSVERLTQRSTLVVRAQAQESWSEWGPDRRMIYTITRFRVMESLKGEAAELVEVKQPGGRMGPYEQRVSGVRPFRASQEAVLFLQPSKSNSGQMVVTALMQGSFTITEDRSGKYASNGVSGVETYDPATKDFRSFRGDRIPLRLLLERVRKAAAL